MAVAWPRSVTDAYKRLMMPPSKAMLPGWRSNGGPPSQSIMRAAQCWQQNRWVQLALSISSDFVTLIQCHFEALTSIKKRHKNASKPLVILSVEGVRLDESIMFHLHESCPYMEQYR